MFYEKKIKYLDYLVNGVRNGNAGFLKIEARGTVCNMTLQVKGLRNTDSFRCPVYLIGKGTEKEIGCLELVQGRGNVYLMGENLSNLGGVGISYDMIEAIRVTVSEGREIRGVLREIASVVQSDDVEAKNEGKKEVKYEEAGLGEAEIEYVEIKEVEFAGIEGYKEEVTAKSESSMKSEQGKEYEARILLRGDIEPRLDKEFELETEFELEMEHEKERIHKNIQENMTNEIWDSACEDDFRKKILEKPRRVLADCGSQRIRLCNSKWEQLWEIYPHIAPFRDEREYLSIGPSDFVVLPTGYFCLANNSFLLHGYYNYKHLVLKRIATRGEEKYYIGVPGTFFEREKQVAVMFGFESFECLEEPAGTGDYGYYMMKIEL